MTDHFNGSFDGSPAFLGYFLAVCLSFSIITNDLPISVPGSWNFTVSLIQPPNNAAAFLESSFSFSTSPDLYDINIPPIRIYGIQYSDKVARLATALETHKSYFSLYSFCFA